MTRIVIREQVLQRFESNEERIGAGKDDTSKEDTRASMANKDKAKNVSKSAMVIDQTSDGNGTNRVAVPASSIASSRQKTERMANGHGPGGLFDSSVMSQVQIRSNFFSNLDANATWAKTFSLSSLHVTRVAG